jgi:hypothetical protein
MRTVGMIALAVAGMSTAALAQEADIPKAVSCAALSQQFTDSLKAAKADDAAKQAAADQAKQGDQDCMAHKYDAGLDQLRQALQQIGLKPIR